MATYLQEILGDVLEVAKPSAGLSFWARGRSGFDFDGWLLRARSLGVRMQPGSYFSLDGASLAATRLGFGSLDQSEMEMVFERLRKTL